MTRPRQFGKSYALSVRYGIKHSFAEINDSCAIGHHL
jgi:hypothetical protein